MDGATYQFNSTAEIQLTRLLGFQRLTAPKIKLSGPTTIVRDKSTSPAPGKFRARTTMKELTLSGKLLGAPVTVTLNSSKVSEGFTDGRADPGSSDPSSPEPIGPLKSNFLVYVQVSTPFGTLVNQEPVEMRATISSMPPDPGKYRQYSPARDLYDDKFKIAAQMQCAAHNVSLVLGGGDGGKKKPKG
jgi:hypothetical protein